MGTILFFSRQGLARAQVALMNHPIIDTRWQLLCGWFVDWFQFWLAVGKGSIIEEMGSCIIFTLIFHTKYTMLMSSTIVVSEETDLDGGEGRNMYLMQ